MPLSRLDKHRNSVQNGMVESFTAFTATVFVPIFSFYVAATFCPLDGNCKNDKKTKKLQKASQVQKVKMTPPPDPNTPVDLRRHFEPASREFLHC